MPHNAQKSPLQVQHAKTIHQPQRKWVRLDECESSYNEIRFIQKYISKMTPKDYVLLRGYLKFVDIGRHWT